MKEIYSNINIIGGGMIGATTAYSLSLLGFKINLIEKNDKYNPSKHEDSRTIAISEGSKNFLSKLGLWSDINRFAQPINKIKVIDRKFPHFLDFDNKRRNSNLGYIVKNKHLLNILYKKLQYKKNVNILNKSVPTSFEYSQDFIITKTKDNLIYSDLNIAADGKNSSTKKIFKTPVFFKDYKKSALVLTFSHSINHNNTAFEFFYKNGPLAILPMKKEKNKYMSSIVWTNENNYIDSLKNLDDKYLQSILNNETKNIIGKINRIVTKQVFPISAHLNTTFYEKKTIYIGDSAHSFHPIAGQGWNLGIKDLKNLYQLAKRHKSLGLELGSNLFCKEYHNSNFYNAYLLYQITDKFDRVFKIQNPLFKVSRFTGIDLIQRNKKINNFLSDIAMGVN
ncbi:FAD-dependent monooxygenase [Pelagibacteraceae bacterium]|nr:FAD-dependent monooxygenase [Pelagibacteraceae bacterium]